MWTDAYIGIPFKREGHDRNGLDCWRLIVLIYKERLGIELPSYKDAYSERSRESLCEVARLMREERTKWQKVFDPRPFDIVHLRVGDLAHHVGIVIDRSRMLHIMEGINSMIEEFTGIYWRDRIEGFFRYAG
jgi:cell wall-associated NlpC family hydrolase